MGIQDHLVLAVRGGIHGAGHEIAARDCANDIAVHDDLERSGAYRGAGRPEATQLIERVLDVAADKLGMDPAEIRRANFIQPASFPMTLSASPPPDGTFASPSPDGTQVIWSSNWGTPGAPVADYVARISWPAPRAVAMHATTGSH